MGLRKFEVCLDVDMEDVVFEAENFYFNTDTGALTFTTGRTMVAVVTPGFRYMREVTGDASAR